MEQACVEMLTPTQKVADLSARCSALERDNAGLSRRCERLEQANAQILDLFLGYSAGLLRVRASLIASATAAS